MNAAIPERRPATEEISGLIERALSTTTTAARIRERMSSSKAGKT
jgi:hypothetical protein